MGLPMTFIRPNDNSISADHKCCCVKVAVQHPVFRDGVGYHGGNNFLRSTDNLLLRQTQKFFVFLVVAAERSWRKKAEKVDHKPVFPSASENALFMSCLRLRPMMKTMFSSGKGQEAGDHLLST